MNFKLKKELKKEIEKLKTIDNKGEYEEQLEKIERLKALTKNDNLYLDYLKLVVEASGIILPLLFYTKLFKEGIKFEETGTFSSVTFKNLMGKINPKK